MFKLFAVACIFATAFAAPGGVVVAPVAHVAHVAAPVAVSHSSSHIVHSAPVVKTVVAAHAVPVAHAVPLAHAVPIAHAVPVAHAVRVAPVVAHHHAVVGPAVVKTVYPAHSVLVH